ncbi:MAG: hypothetical protein LUD14_02470 [Clostridiales bacterium]|nr:hypothetical protein [Clostridiales bacterium]
MQGNTVLLGGFEPSYMKKLALYLTARMGGQVQVGIVDELQSESVKDQEAVWIGSERFLEEVRAGEKALRCILLTEEEGEDGGICRYQSCEKLYQRIMFFYRQMEGVPIASVNTAGPKWVVLTTDQSVSQLLAFSTVCAQILSETAEVLYLNFSECCGMRDVFLLEDDGTDLADLAVELAGDGPVCLDTVTRRLERINYILPTANPMILHEIRAQDISRLIQAVEQSGKYQYVVAAVGTSCCGCDQFFLRASQMFHLTGEGALAACSRQEWEEFIRLCRGGGEVSVREVRLPFIEMENRGIHLLQEWADGEIGQLARKYLGFSEDS